MSQVFAVHLSPSHTFSKNTAPEIELLSGLGVQGDAHCGELVKHRSRVKKDPSLPNLRQVHLIHWELIQELRKQGFKVSAGTMGENITTQQIDLLSLPKGTRLDIGTSAQIEITGLRNPCKQLDNYQNGLTAAVLDRDEKGQLIRRAGIMGIVIQGGTIRPQDAIEVKLPPLPHLALERV